MWRSRYSCREADHLVEVGSIEPENVVTAGAYVNYIVDGGSI